MKTEWAGGSRVAPGRRMFSHKLHSDRWQRGCCHIRFLPASETVAVKDKSAVKKTHTFPPLNEHKTARLGY